MLTCLKESFKRFATGCCAVWYPQLQRLESRDLPEKLKLLGEMDWLHVSPVGYKPVRPTVLACTAAACLC